MSIHKIWIIKAFTTKKCLIPIFVIFIPFFLFSQGLAFSIGSTGNDIGYKIDTDVSGNIYVAGYFSGTMDADPGLGVYQLQSNGASDIFVAKYNSNGNLLWAKSFGGNAADEGKSIYVDIFNNVYVVGNFYGMFDFDPGIGIRNISSNGDFDGFVEKLDNNGNFLWASNFGGPSYDNCSDIVTDNLGNIFVTGDFQSTADFDPGPGNFALATNGFADIFIMKLNTSGGLIWAKNIGGVGYDYGMSLCLDLNSNIYITGHFQSNVDFDPGINLTNIVSKGGYDAFVLKLNAESQFQWALSVGGTDTDYGNSISIDNNNNSIYFTGSFSGIADFDPGLIVSNVSSNGGFDFFLEKIDVNGNLIWYKTAGGISNDFGYDIITDNIGNVYTVGYFYQTVDFDPGPGLVNLVSNGLSDIFILKLNNNGSYLWCKSFGGTGMDFGLGVCITQSNFLLITGFFNNTVDFDPDPPIFNLISNGGQDCFLLKLLLSGSLPSESVNLVARKENEKQNKISWQISSVNESVSGIFYIQKSNDGIKFCDVDSLMTHVTNLFNTQQYFTYDKKLPLNNIYYRIKFSAKNNRTIYSPIAYICYRADQNPIINIWPNPTSKEIYCTSNRVIRNIKVYNLKGQKLIDVMPNTDNSINISTLPKGTYFVDIIFSDYQRKTVQIIKW